MQRKWPAVLGALLLSGAALAQERPIARIDPVPPNPTDPIVAPVFDAIRARGGEPLNMHRTLANAPQIFKAYVDLAIALRANATVPRQLRELIIIRTAQKAGGDYEATQHRPMALSCGLTRTQLEAIATWQGSSEFDARQRAVLAYAEEMAADKGVSDATFKALAEHFNPREIVELTITAGFYGAAARVTRALDVQLEKGAGDDKNTYGKC